MKNLRNITAIVWLSVMGMVATPQPCSADTAVVLKNKLVAAHATIRISDLFDGVPPVIDREIARAPEPGKQVIYDSATLTRIAHTYRLDWQPDSAADHVVITRPAIHITADQIRDEVLNKVRADGVVSLAKASSIDVAFDTHNLQMDLPADQEPSISLSNFSLNPANKYFRADVVAETSAGPQSMPVTGHIILRRSVPVLSRHLEAHTVISASDLEYVQMAEDRISTAAIQDERELIGRELRHDVNGGDPLSQHDISQPRMVVRGTLVTVQVETPFMQLSVQGKALQDGIAGDVVRVMNIGSNRIVEGTVTGQGTVQVHTTFQRLAAAR